ncbi:hypothetical protein [Streptomyces sp. Ac-502]|uniref:hypothetical protein n=1 Tax=Streptomyces sp. Ac-502 TaxID=3342801 RepID=UPI0038623092
MISTRTPPPGSSRPRRAARPWACRTTAGTRCWLVCPNVQRHLQALARDVEGITIAVLATMLPCLKRGEP